ncbi:MAG: hypothetical protein Tsb002_21930 [Wenzhouxiangellaceae bacterium]
MKRWRIPIEIKITGPLLTHSIEARHFSEDARGLTHQGKPALPGTHLKGHWREALEAIATLLQQDSSGTATPSLTHAMLEEWFGPDTRDRPRAAVDGYSQGATDGDGDWTPRRAALNFDAYWLGDSGTPTPLTRIQIKPETGTVESGALLVAVSPLAPGEQTTFRGDIETDLPETTVKNQLAPWLQRAADGIQAVGASTTVGFGQVDQIVVGEPHELSADSSVTPLAAEHQAIGITLKLDRPFCFAQPHTRGNVLHSTDYIPGGAIIGALAEALQRSGATSLPLLRQHLHALHVSHAQPLPGDAGDQRLTPLPFSLAVQGGSAEQPQLLIDAADAPGPVLLGQPGRFEAPAFASDWKDPTAEGVKKRLGHPSAPERTLIVRNRISRQANGRAADEGALFAIEAVEPGSYQWRANIQVNTAALAAGVQPGELLNQLQQALSHGLTGLGKTKARARVTCEPQPWPADIPGQSSPDPSQPLKLLLASDAILIAQTAVLPGTAGGPALLSLYADYFARISDQQLQLQRVFTKERWVGGRYLQQRFWNPARADQPYQPKLLTLAGSVFVFKPLTTAQAQSLQSSFEQWRRLGLPPGHVIDPQGDVPGRDTLWQHQPYLDAQGYGEIRINPTLEVDKLEEGNHVVLTANA